MEQSEQIKIYSDYEDKEIIRQQNEMVFATMNLTPIQTDIFYRSLTKFNDIDPDDIEEEKIYPAEFQRSEIPRVNYTEHLVKVLRELQDIKIESNTDTYWFRLTPFPKIGEYRKGKIKVWFLGEFLKPILQIKKEKGYAVIMLAEMFKIHGSHSKKLFAIFSSYKNRSGSQFELEVNYIKEVLGIPDKYKGNPGMFKRMVIDAAINQINEKTSIDVAVRYKTRKGRRPAILSFSVKRKNETVQEEFERANEVQSAEKTKELQNNEFTNEEIRVDEDSQFKCRRYLLDEDSERGYFKATVSKKSPSGVNELSQVMPFFTDYLRKKGEKPSVEIAKDMAKCYNYLCQYGFEVKQAKNCAVQEKTRKLFWNYRSENQLHTKNYKEMDLNQVRMGFFKILKANDCKI